MACTSLTSHAQCKSAQRLLPAMRPIQITEGALKGKVSKHRHAEGACLGKGRQAVGCAGGVGHNVILLRVVLLLVHAHHKHGRVCGQGSC